MAMRCVGRYLLWLRGAAQATQRLGARRTNARDGGLIALTVITVLLAVGAAHAAQESTLEPGPTAPADDLPAEFKLLLGTDSEHDYRWTLVGKNDKAQEQEKLHPELNAIHAIWHFPLARDRSVFKFEFTRRSGRAAMYSTSMSRPTATRRRAENTTASTTAWITCLR